MVDEGRRYHLHAGRLTLARSVGVSAICEHAGVHGISVGRHVERGHRVQEGGVCELCAGRGGLHAGKQPAERSYVIGFGSNWPKCPHHRAASPAQQCPSLYQLTGAMVGGPDSSDNFNDQTMNYQQTEVAIDYQAVLVASLAAMTGPKEPPEYVHIPEPPTPGPVGTGTGLTGEYFNNTSLTAPVVLTRTDATLNLRWGGGSPGTGVNADQFSVRWTGQVQPRYTDTYTFYLMSDDGSRLWVNNHWLSIIGQIMQPNLNMKNRVRLL